MSSDLMQVLLAAGGMFLAIAAVILLGVVIVYRMSPGRALIGVRRYEDLPVRPLNLPRPIRLQMYDWRRWLDDHDFNIDDDEARVQAGVAVSNGCYEFELAKPLPVKVVPPRKPGTRIKWKLV